MNRFIMTGLAAAAIGIIGCQNSAKNEPGPTPEARSLLGDRGYFAVPLDEATRAAYEANLAAAQAAYDADPKSEEAIIWLGRRQAYLGRYREAIETFTNGLRTHPDSVKLLRHRGHRWITVREFDRAIADLSRAHALIISNSVPDEIEPDGIPNARNIPLTTLHDNVAYHLALAHYLNGQFSEAARMWRHGLMRATPNDDMLVAYTYWLYLAESRAGEKSQANARLAALPQGLDVIENTAYENLLRIRQQQRSPMAEASGLSTTTSDGATMLYGLGAFALLDQDESSAVNLWRRCLDSRQWSAFGYIAAEADLARLGPSRSSGLSPEQRNNEQNLREIQRDRQRNR